MTPGLDLKVEAQQVMSVQAPYYAKRASPFSGSADCGNHSGLLLSVIYNDDGEDLSELGLITAG